MLELLDERYADLKESTILIAEDDDFALQSLEKTLKRYFKTVLTASNGYEAYQKSLSTPTDIILTDMRMPFQDGADFIKKIRLSNPTLPIIIMSAYQDSETLLKLIPLNITEYLIKPIEIANVLALSHKILHKPTHANKLYQLRGGVSVDLENKIIQRDDELIFLTKKEFELLSFLITNKQSILSKTEIEYALWDGEMISESSVKTLLKKLRLKIGEESIITAKNMGYKIDILH